MAVPAASPLAVPLTEKVYPLLTVKDYESPALRLIDYPLSFPVRVPEVNFPVMVVG